VLWASAATIFSVASAGTNFTVKTPGIGEILAGPADLRLEAISFGFDMSTNRYRNATLEAKNYDATVSHSGSIHIELYSADNTLIATGTGATGLISPGVRIGNILVVFTWTGAYTAENFARGRYTLTQIS